jgi:hypothetical protein
VDDIDQPTGDGIRLFDNFATFIPPVGNILTLSGSPLVSALNLRPTGTGGDFVFFRINGDAPPPSDFRSALSFSNAPGSPTLSVTYGPVPEPSVLGLTGIAVAALAARRHRIRKA